MRFSLNKPIIFSAILIVIFVFSLANFAHADIISDALDSSANTATQQSTNTNNSGTATTLTTDQKNTLLTQYQDQVDRLHYVNYELEKFVNNVNNIQEDFIPQDQVITKINNAKIYLGNLQTYLAELAQKGGVDKNTWNTKYDIAFEEYTKLNLLIDTIVKDKYDNNTKIEKAKFNNKVTYESLQNDTTRAETIKDGQTQTNTAQQNIQNNAQTSGGAGGGGTTSSCEEQCKKIPKKSEWTIGSILGYDTSFEKVQCQLECFVVNTVMTALNFIEGILKMIPI